LARTVFATRKRGASAGAAVTAAALVAAAAALLAVAPLVVPREASAQDTTRVARDSGQIVGDTTQSVRIGVLRPGDVLRIAVYRDKEFSGEFQIDSRGYVQIPGLGDIAVAGLRPEAARDRIRERLVARGIATPDIAMEALIRVSVLGEVRQPQILSVDPGTSILQLLARAGGPTEQADLSRARVLREGRSYQVDLKSAFAGAVTGRYLLFSNDVLVVPRRRNFSRETWSLVLSTTTAAVSVATFILTVRR
jgi:polysaccharide export outer membrane protein